jgi:hypothetical protein
MARFIASQGSLTEAINTLADQTTATTRAATVNTAASPLQLTAAMMLGGIFITSTAGAFQANLPVPAAFVAAIPNCQVGTTVVCFIRNDGDNTLTLATNSVTGITLSGTATLATTLGQIVVFKITNVTAAAEAYTCYVGLKVAN